VTYVEAAAMPFADVLNRYQQLNDRDSTARAIATLQARGQWREDRTLDPASYPPLTAGEHLELIALGEVIARHYRHPVHVHYAVLAGATWEQIGAASGADADEARAAYQGWAHEQHEVRLEFPGGTIGPDDSEFEAAMKAVQR
jgi:hypothetical protein